ncbi:MAG: hypothetical protein LBU27_05560 [Candidatus Peribacteria bacterium]|jgi:hypothetical protein|nr:hypothetical protein [Candidatus Peribacteria bacterium]
MNKNTIKKHEELFWVASLVILLVGAYYIAPVYAFPWGTAAFVCWYLPFLGNIILLLCRIGLEEELPDLEGILFYSSFPVVNTLFILVSLFRLFRAIGKAIGKAIWSILSVVKYKNLQKEKI